MAKLLYQGHASCRIENKAGKILYLDPFAGEGYTKTANLVLITHEHYDHNDITLVPMDERTIIIRHDQALINGHYFSFDYFGYHIQAVPAYNKNHNRNECVGFLIQTDGVTIYFSGDTSKIPEMEEIGKVGIDCALMPIDGEFNMGPAEASECAEIVHARHFIPIHSHVGLLFDMKQAMKVTYPGAMLVRPGNLVELKTASEEKAK